MYSSLWRSNPTIYRVLGHVLGITLVIKLMVVLAYGPSYVYHSDDREYLRSAELWLDTGMFTYNDPERPTLFITPAYPGLIAMLMKLFGPGLLLEQFLRALQVLLITFSLVVLFKIGERIFGTPSAFWGTCMAACYPPLWLIANMLFTESLFILLLLLLIWSAFQMMERPGWRSALLFGLVWAAAVYVRPTIALWPGLLWLWALWRRQLSVRRLFQSGLIAFMAFSLCLAPWWVRNYEVSGGEFIPLTQSGGNPLLLGTYPYTVPALFMEEQLTWHEGGDLRQHNRQDTRIALERIEQGFKEQFWLYGSWYTVGKFALLWGDVFYWLPIPGVPLVAVVLYHYLLLGLGCHGLLRLRNHNGVSLLITLFAYTSVLHMVFLAHSRYALPLMPLLCLLAGAVVHQQLLQRENSLKKRLNEPKTAT